MPKSQEQFDHQAGQWFGLTIRSWTPIAIAIISLVGYIQMLSFNIRALQVQAANLEESNADLNKTLSGFSDRLTKIEANTNQTKDDLRALKIFFKLP